MGESVGLKVYLNGEIEAQIGLRNSLGYCGQAVA